MSARSGNRSGNAPPWLWVWTATFVWQLPGLAHFAYGLWDEVSRELEADRALMSTGAVSNRLGFLLYPAHFLDILPAAALAAGLAAALLPAARARLLERRLQLRPVKEDGTLKEIVDFVRARAPRAEIRANPHDVANLAFVYPCGFRRSRLAICGGLIGFWRSDRAAACAVLQHELVHLRYRDDLLAGTGSLLEAVLRHAILIYLVVFVTPFAIVGIEHVVRSVHGLRELGIDVHTISKQEFRAIGSFVAAQGFIPIASIFKLLAVWCVPLAALWTAELNADVAASRSESPEAAERALGQIASGYGWWRWVLSRLTHPPVFLRRLLVRRPIAAPIALVLIFPVAYAVRLALLHCFAISAYLLNGQSRQEIAAAVVGNTRTYMRANTMTWVVMGITIGVWLAFQRRTHDNEVSDRA
jgi:Zn-dependent protease with chaperone function